MVKAVWESMPTRFPNIELGASIVMPNHFHGIVIIRENVGATLVVARDGSPTQRAETSPAPTLGNIIGAFKSITTHAYIDGVGQLGWPTFDKRVWQRNYFERVIRNEAEWNRIHLYIESNPMRWAEDEENPNRK
jgi:REP element-mobilizing transposase RayT